MATDSNPGGLSSGVVRIADIDQTVPLELTLSNATLYSNATAVTISGRTFSTDTTVSLLPGSGRPISVGTVTLVDLFTLQLEITQLGPSNEGAVDAQVCQFGSQQCAQAQVFTVAKARPRVDK